MRQELPKLRISQLADPLLIWVELNGPASSGNFINMIMPSPLDCGVAGNESLLMRLTAKQRLAKSPLDRPAGSSRKSEVKYTDTE